MYQVYEVKGVGSYEIFLIVVAADNKDAALFLARASRDFLGSAPHDVLTLHGVYSNRPGVLSSASYSE